VRTESTTVLYTVLIQTFDYLPLKSKIYNYVQVADIFFTF